MHLEDLVLRSIWSSGDLTLAFIAGPLCCLWFYPVGEPGTMASSSQLLHSTSLHHDRPS